MHYKKIPYSKYRHLSSFGKGSLISLNQQSIKSKSDSILAMTQLDLSESLKLLISMLDDLYVYESAFVLKFNWLITWNILYESTKFMVHKHHSEFEKLG